MAEINGFLERRAKEGLLRTLRPINMRQHAKIRVLDKEYSDFSSNDYLGLSGHPRIIEAGIKALEKFGTSSSSSRLMSGDLEIHHELEEKVAEFKHKEAALVFNSGYQANVGIISALYQKGDCIFSDRLNHASIIDGIILSGARLLRFRHNDIAHLGQLLRKERGRFAKALIVAETVFSMDGDMPPLKELVRLKEQYGCRLMVDEAHATGVFGENGSGLVEEEGLPAQVDLIMGTFSKALGGFGAYVAGSRKIIDYLINTARSFIYSTALPAVVIAGNLASLDLVRDEPQRRAVLLENADYFRNALKQKGFSVRGSSQIIPLVIGENSRTVKFAQEMQGRGYWVLPVRPPAVPNNEARLRLSLTFHHDRPLLEKLIKDICAVKV